MDHPTPVRPPTAPKMLQLPLKTGAMSGFYAHQPPFLQSSGSRYAIRWSRPHGAKDSAARATSSTSEGRCKAQWQCISSHELRESTGGQDHGPVRCPSACPPSWFRFWLPLPRCLGSLSPFMIPLLSVAAALSQACLLCDFAFGCRCRLVSQACLSSYFARGCRCHLVSQAYFCS